MPYPSKLTQVQLIEKLRETRRLYPGDGDFFGVDLQGADLSGVSLSMVSLAAANLDSANLTGCQFRQVDLTNASLKNANLTQTRFELTHAGSASFVGAQATESRWEQVGLTGADFSNVNLTQAVIRGSNLESSCFKDADLSNAMLVYSNANSVSFHRTCFLWSNTVGSSFTQADFADARDFFVCREIVTEILRREIGDSLERSKIVGSVAVSPQWCYADWKQFLEAEPQYREIAFEIFSRYPESGFIEALSTGWRGTEPLNRRML